jgi:hypothetical protein
VDDAEHQALLDAAFDFLCERRAGEFVEVDRLVAALDEAATEPRVAQALARWSAPSRARLLARLKASGLKLGVWLPEAARDRLAEILGRPVRLPRALADEAVASARVRETVKAVLQETLSRFIAKAIAATPGGAGLKGVLGLGARAAGGLFGALGEEVQRLLQDRMREFLDTGVQLVQKRLAEKLASAETAELIGRQARKTFLQLLERREAEVANYAERVPWAELDALVPAIAVHNLARAELREALKAELSATLADLSTQTLGELLDAFGLRARARDAFHKHGGELLRAFLASPHYARIKATG